MSKRVIDYMIVRDDHIGKDPLFDIYGLPSAVRKQMNEGWEPLGSPFATADFGIMCQAMVKYE